MGRLIRTFVVLALATVVVFGVVGVARATAPNGWTYAYSSYVSGTTWVYSQSTARAARHWPAPGYTTSSSYYRLGNSLSSLFKARSRTAAATWSAVDPMFHFYELPLGSDPYDHTLGSNPDIQYPGVNIVDMRWDSANDRAYVHNWYIRYRTSLSGFGLYWYDGAAPDGVDILSVATHEFGHAVLLEDVIGSWSDSTRPTMYFEVVPGNLFARTLAAGDITGISGLY